MNVAYALGHDGHRQYFFNRDGVRVAPAEGDYVIDGGACFGDTAVLFACAAGPEGRVFAFEPLPQHHEVIARNIDQNLLGECVYIVPNGLGAVTSHVAQIDPSLSGIANPGFSLAEIEHAVPAITIDDVLVSQGIGKMDFIKLDVEGYELAALQGAAHTLDTLRLKLAVSLYHKPGDFFEFPLYLRERHPHYFFTSTTTPSTTRRRCSSPFRRTERPAPVWHGERACRRGLSAPSTAAAPWRHASVAGADAFHRGGP